MTARYRVILLLVLLGLAQFGLVQASRGSSDQDLDEDRPPIIVSSGSVIISVQRGAWVREGVGRFKQELPNGRDVTGFSVSTGAGTAAACTIAGPSITVTYGANTIRFERAMQAAPQRQRRRTDVQLPANASVTARDARTLVIETSDPLVSFSNGGNRPVDTCQVAGGRLEIRQIH